MDLGDRIKFYECSDRFIPTLPVIARIDGRNFHSYTKNAEKPFDGKLQNLFNETVKALMAGSGAKLGYTQSDEISLCFIGDWFSRIYFDGKVQKLVSCLASEATFYFNNIADKPAMFDCRCFQVPSLVEATNYFIWREQDAVRNSIQMAARSVFSHKECDNKNCSQLQDMLISKGINWNDYSSRSKRGSYFKRVKKQWEVPLEFRKGEQFIERSFIEEVDLPILTTIENRVGVLFGYL